MSETTFRNTVLILLVLILVSVAKPEVLMAYAVIWVLFVIGAFVAYKWDGDREVDDWLDPGRTKRRK